MLWTEAEGTVTANSQEIRGEVVRGKCQICVKTLAAEHQNWGFPHTCLGGMRKIVSLYINIAKRLRNVFLFLQNLQK